MGYPLPACPVEECCTFRSCYIELTAFKFVILQECRLHTHTHRVIIDFLSAVYLKIDMLGFFQKTPSFKSGTGLFKALWQT